MAFRAVVSVGSGASRTQVMVDFVLVGVNRTEITLITTAPYSEAASVAAGGAASGAGDGRAGRSTHRLTGPRRQF